MNQFGRGVALGLALSFVTTGGAAQTQDPGGTKGQSVK